jgi:hypothetical protein
MGEVISLSQYRKERIREVNGGRSSESKVRYGLVKSGKLDSESVRADAKNDRMKGVVEFHGKETGKPENGPSDTDREDV